MNECEQSAAVSVNEIFDDEGKSRDGTFLKIIFIDKASKSSHCQSITTSGNQQHAPASALA